MDIVVAGDATLTNDEPTLQRVAAAMASKYGEPFAFTVRDGAFWSDDGGIALVFEVRPMKAFGFGKATRSARLAGGSRAPRFSPEESGHAIPHHHPAGR